MAEIENNSIENQSVTEGRSALLTLPNLIGYFRVALIVVVIFTAFKHPLLTFVLYFVSANLDAVDGYLARRLGQVSKLGTVLDYAIDRGSDTVLFMILATVYREWWSFFCLMLMLDIFSHICQVYSTVFSTQKSHKQVGKRQGLLLGLYYSNRKVLYWACASHDLWLGCLYLLYFFPSSWLFYVSFIFLPGFAFKVLIHVLQILNACKRVAAM